MSTPSAELSTRTQLLAMLSVPILALVVYAVVTVLGALGEMRASRHSGAAVRVAVAGSQLAHEQQKERGLSGGFLASKGEQFREQLATQREASNQQLERLKVIVRELADGQDVADGLVGVAETAVTRAGELADLRRQVDAQSVKAGESFARYTAAIAANIEVIAAVAKGARSADIARQATAYLMFVQAKEYAGRERATLNAAFAAKSFEPESFRRFIGIVSAHELYLNAFRAYATADATAFLDNTLIGNAVDEVVRLRKRAQESIAGQEFDVPPAQWFAASTARIDLMKTVESKLEEQIESLLARQSSAAKRTLMVALLGSALSIAVALLLGGAMIRRLLRRLGGEPATAATIARSIAGGDLTQPIVVAPGDTDSVMAAMKTMQEGLREMIASIHQASAEVTSEAARLSTSSSQVAAATSTNSRSAESIAAAVEQLAGSIQSIATNSASVHGSSRQTGEAATAGAATVSRAAAEMRSIADVVHASAASVNELGKESEQIAAIAQVIREIADQTNLLALNAAIEAARAGEQGRGFAVVADEVRKLAERTRLSTLEISTTIERIRSCMAEAEQSMADGTARVRDALAESGHAETSMGEIQQAASVVISSVDEISAVLREQSGSSLDISRNAVAIAAGSEQVSSSTESMAGIAQHLEALATELTQTVNRFRIA